MAPSTLAELPIEISQDTWPVDQDLLRHYLPLLGRRGYHVGVHERKGTAMLRRIIALCGEARPVTWDRVLSTATLVQQARRGELKGKVLLVDDLLKTGRTIVQVVDRLLRAGVQPRDICVAVLGSHDSFDLATLAELGVEIRIWRKSLADDAYVAYRRALVDTLQSRPGPFLDTEHIEVTVELRGHRHVRPPSFLALVDALARTGEVVTLPGGSGGRRASVYYPANSKHPSAGELGLGGKNAGIVRKCRVVEAGPNRYRLLAICLPDVDHDGDLSSATAEHFARQVLATDSAADHVKKLFAEDPGSYREQFFHRSIVASLQPLLWALQDIYVTFGTAHAQVSVPTEREDLSVSIAHLAVAYPGIDVSVLSALLWDAIHGAQLRAKELPKVAGDVVHLDEHRLGHLAERLEQLVSIRVDQQVYERSMGLRRDEDELGIEHSALLKLGAQAGMPAAMVSAVLDEVLDRARFSTKVQTLAAGRTVRTYKPDGEVTAQSLRGERRAGFFSY